MPVLLSLAAATAFSVAAALVYLLTDRRWGLRVLDHPNERSLHTRPIPRTGGVGIVAGVAAGGWTAVVAGSVAAPPVWLFLCAAAVAAVSFVDDLRGLPAVPRLAAHVAAALGLIAVGVAPGALEVPGAVWAWPAWVGGGVALLGTVWMTNLYNFMDGMDGLAGGMAVVGFGALAVLGLVGGRPDFAVLSLVVVAAAAGFLLFNFPPARIFMGDVGSSTLGFLAAAMILWGNQEGLFPLWVAALVFSPFVVDATATLLRRALAREKVWQAHRSHYYQRLVRVGWGHRRTVVLEYLLMLGCALSALLANRASVPVQWTVLGAWVLAYVVLGLSVTRLERRAGGVR